MRKTAIFVCLFAITQFAYAQPMHHAYTSQLPYQPGSKIPVVVKTSHLKWRTVSPYSKAATVLGDPKKAGPFVLLLKYARGFHKEPHYHPGTAVISVLKGTYYRGYGSVYNKKSKAVAKLTAGTVSVNPAGVDHYEWAVKPTIIAVYAMGPWKTVYVNSKNQPIPMKDVKNPDPRYTM